MTTHREWIGLKACFYARHPVASESLLLVCEQCEREAGLPPRLPLFLGLVGGLCGWQPPLCIEIELRMVAQARPGLIEKQLDGYRGEITPGYGRSDECGLLG